MITDINSEDRLVQATFAEYLREHHGWESVYAYNDETFGPEGTLGRLNEREIVLLRDLRLALVRLNPDLPNEATEQAVAKLAGYDHSRSLLQHNRDFYRMIRDGVPVRFQDTNGDWQNPHLRVIDFENRPGSNRLLVVRELKIQGLQVPHYNRRADLVCFVNGLPLVFIELKAVYKNVRLGFDGNLTDYMTEQVIPHAFYHNAFLVVSNGDSARYGTITSLWGHFLEWKRNEEKDKGRVDARMLLDGMLQPERLLDLVQNFILFDESKPEGVRKVIARNHQVLGVNNAVASVEYQEALKRQFPERERIRYVAHEELSRIDPLLSDGSIIDNDQAQDKQLLPLVERAHPDLGRLGVFWHTQGSGKSYSMAFLIEKVRRKVPGAFTFVIMTDREDLDDQIYRTFAGVGIADKTTPRAESGKDLERLLRENHRLIFTLIQKFRREEPPKSPYSTRDDIIVVSDEAHRTQSGKLARYMRLALPNASFIGFTGTPLFKYDHLTRRIFGGYVSRYDFKRSEEDGSTVKLVYDSRGEKLGISRIDLNERIAAKIEEAELDPDQKALLEKLLGKDYEIITADDRLDKLADDFVTHCSTRWESGKSMLVCIDKLTCARMYQRIIPRWKHRVQALEGALPALRLSLADCDREVGETLAKEIASLEGQTAWMNSTLVGIIISEAQNEVKDFAKWDFDIVPHRSLIKQGFETSDGRRIDVETAFKDPKHPFRVAIVCAMWLTGFDVECLSTLYIDKPMKAHTLMQAIARPNRIYPGKVCGVIVDYNGMLKSLREALAQYALGDDSDDDLGDIVAPIEDLLASLMQAIEETERHLLKLGFDPASLIGAKGFDRIAAIRDAVEVIYTTDEAKRRFEIMARTVFERFRALLMEPSAYQFAERRDNIETIYKKLGERRDTADVTELLKELHRIVNGAIRAQDVGDDLAEGLKVDLSEIDFTKLREEFARKLRRKNTALQDIRQIVEDKLQAMLLYNPQRMDYYKKYQEIIADYNREKDRATVEATFAQLVELVRDLDAEQRRAVEEGLSEDELALFDMLNRDSLPKAQRERLKQASRDLIAQIKASIRDIPHWTRNPQTQAEIEVLIIDELHRQLPIPPFSESEREEAAGRIFEYVWQRSADDAAFNQFLAA